MGRPARCRHWAQDWFARSSHFNSKRISARMNINDQFPSKYLKASDIKGKKVPLTVSHLTNEEIGGEQKVILFFQGKAKGMVLNKTNSMTIAASYGPETDGWVGQQIILYSGKVNYNNQLVDALKVEIASQAVQDEDIPF